MGSEEISIEQGVATCGKTKETKKSTHFLRKTLVKGIGKKRAGTWKPTVHMKEK